MKFSKIVILSMLAAALLSAQGHVFGGPGIRGERGLGFEAIGPWGGAPVTGMPFTAIEVRSFSWTTMLVTQRACPSQSVPGYEPRSSPISDTQ